MRHRYLKDVTTLSLNAEKCVGCGLCAVVCPHGVFTVDERKVQIVERDFCIECGACALNCPTKTLEISPGVGCAVAIIAGWVTGGEPNCDCGILGTSNKTQCC